MNTHTVLSFEQAPPFDVPLRFFLTAPWFLVLAAALIAWEGPDIFASRWTPSTLALVHLMTLGFMAHVMSGALFQMLPVVVGVVVPQPRRAATILHLSLTAGTVLLSAAFLIQKVALFHAAMTLLAMGFGTMLWVIQQALWRAPVANPTVISLRCALIALTATVLLGLLLGSMLSTGRPVLPIGIIALTDIHMVWGLIGWTGLLIVGVAYQVVPMFQMTAPYPLAFGQWFAPSIVGLLVLWTAVLLGSILDLMALVAALCAGIGLYLAVHWRGDTATAPYWGYTLIGGLVALSALQALRLLNPLFGEATLSTVLGTALAVGMGSFAVITVRLLWTRRRKVADPTLGYWYLSMVSVLSGALIGCADTVFPAIRTAIPTIPLITGTLLIYGAAVTLINGMLYKIVPFLAWFHLQARRFEGGSRPPHMRQLLPETWIVRQFWLSLVTILSMLAALLVPALTSFAALLIAVTGAWIGALLIKVWRAYLRHQAISR